MGRPAELDAPGTTAGPDPTRVATLDDLVRELNLLRSRAARGTRSARISLEELAGRVGEPKSTVHAYLTGRRLAPAQLLDRMVIALGTTAAEQREWAEAWYRVCAHREATHRASAPSIAVTVPRQLPPAVAHFTGRLEALAELDRVFAGGGGIAALVGTAGVGTTALAVHWAQARSDRYPDGQLYLDLRGFHPEPPLPSSQALARILRALGVPPAELPRDCAERSALCRSLLAGRRMLVLLDNARDSEQVRELLPDTASCAVLVTSRQNLTGLVARHGARRIEVPTLATDEAVQLLYELAGEPVRRAPAAAAELTELCARLPLALRLAAELVRPDRPLEALVAELAIAADRLDLLAAEDDPSTALRACFGWSYLRLPVPVARAFRLIGRHPGTDLTPDALAALLDGSLPEAHRMLTALAAAHLIEPSRPGHVRLHSLLRLYAGELAQAEAEPAATDRLVAHYLHTAARALDQLTGRRLRLVELAPSCAPAVPFPDPAAARRWLDTERANLAAMVRLVGLGSWPWSTVRLARTVGEYLESGNLAVKSGRPAEAGRSAAESGVAL
ncbi:MAG TPA: helix-turn-helix domain-containing protein [Jatrophihabitans sp.]|nr:helix-turn-helix domain-containing protein [Jatrophihabitans sp.]